MSITRKKYFIRLIARIIIFILCLIMCLYPQNFKILEGMNFFKELHVFHILWLIWVFDIILQIIPIKNTVALGSQKLFKNRFRSIREKINYKALKNYIKFTTKSAYKVFVIWFLLIAVIGILYYFNIINKIWLFMISVFLLCL